ncbi:DUF5665 domain-containing protein [Limnochorda pilosa]|uniref:Membrane protein n=1 Tax=Limnochorda pilosa TaxID=1555112 RepID=A0A0K2SJU5_LIMPI|nr:DUF5665 domain-containing protein [Limnochorda pilosa]BAS27388.1 membrane protein [Limnochorda pilosa]
MRRPAERRDAEGALLRNLVHRVNELGRRMEEAHIGELVEFYRNPRRALLLQLGGGVFRGVGIAIGFTVVSALILYTLTRLAALNLPLIGAVIADIVRIVERELNLGP